MYHQRAKRIYITLPKLKSLKATSISGPITTTSKKTKNYNTEGDNRLPWLVKMYNMQKEQICKKPETFKKSMRDICDSMLIIRI